MKTAKRYGLVICILISAIVLGSCGMPVFSGSTEQPTLYSPIPIPPPSREQVKQFNLKTRAQHATLEKEHGITISGYPTGNREFLNNVLLPLTEPYVEELSRSGKVESINSLTLFVYEAYLVHFSSEFRTWECYRWGGDIFDLDDPQESGHRFDKKFGLDCSGFVAAPYEIAVVLGLLDAANEEAAFCSEGFKAYGPKHDIPDKGGRRGTSNRFRVDSSEMMLIGRPIMYVEQGHSPREEDIAKLQPGDVVVGPGHAGIIAEVEGALFYLEFGRTVIPPEGMTMTPVAAGLRAFAKDYPLAIRRTLPDVKKK